MGSSPRPSDEERFLEAALRHPVLDSPTMASHPDATLLVQVARGTLPASRREELEGHLASCGPCREAVAALIPDPGEARISTALRPVAWLAAAAAVLLALVAGMVWRPWGRSSPPADPLLAAVDALRAADPHVLRGFVPLTSAEVASPPSPVRRGGLRLLQPTGAWTDGRPAFRWEPPPAVTTWTLTVSRADGETLWSRTSSESSLAYPADAAPLAPGGRYMWEIRGESRVGTVEDRRVFRVLSEGDARDFAKATHAIEVGTPENVRWLLLAQYAARCECWAVAEAAIREHRRRWPDDPTGHATRAYVLSAIGADREPR